MVLQDLGSSPWLDQKQMELERRFFFSEEAVSSTRLEVHAVLRILRFVSFNDWNCFQRKRLMSTFLNSI